jgi:hypothetical protein
MSQTQFSRASPPIRARFRFSTAAGIPTLMTHHLLGEGSFRLHNPISATLFRCPKFLSDGRLPPDESLNPGWPVFQKREEQHGLRVEISSGREVFTPF